MYALAQAIFTFLATFTMPAPATPVYTAPVETPVVVEAPDFNGDGAHHVVCPQISYLGDNAQNAAAVYSTLPDCTHTLLTNVFAVQCDNVTVTGTTRAVAVAIQGHNDNCGEISIHV